MILEMKHIDKQYEQGKMAVPVLHDIELEVEEGEYIAIMGPSGSGKTTFMNIIGCLDVPTGGTYCFDGHDVGRSSEKELADMRNHEIGFVFQNFNLLPRQSALDNVMLPLLYAGMPKAERRQRAIESLEKLGLADRMDFMPTQLSGGQQQRVAIARAMVGKPRILLADEPTGALDSKSGIQIMDVFQSLHKEGMTIIVITHERSVAEYAERIIQLSDGRIVAEERAGEAYEKAVSESE